MKKSIIAFSIVLLTAFAFNVNAQCIPQPQAAPGLYPSDDSLDCIVQGVPNTTIIYFKNFGAISGVTVEYLRIDSLQHLPAGLSYCINDPDFTFVTEEIGCIEVTGTTNDVVGQYKLGIYVTLKVSILPNPISGEAGALSAQFGGPDFSYYVRVKADALASCTPIDTTPSATNQAGETAGSLACAVGINEVKSVDGFIITPNPVKSYADVKFTLDNPMDVKVVMYNAVGQQVYNTSVQGVSGENKVSINRGNLQAGLYLLAIEQGSKSLVSKQMMLE